MKVMFHIFASPRREVDAFGNKTVDKHFAFFSEFVPRRKPKALGNGNNATNHLTISDSALFSYDRNTTWPSLGFHFR
jgi:hypothetical protein